MNDRRKSLQERNRRKRQRRRDRKMKVVAAARAPKPKKAKVVSRRQAASHLLLREEWMARRKSGLSNGARRRWVEPVA